MTVTFQNPEQVSPSVVILESDKTSFKVDGIDDVVFTITATDLNGYPASNQLFMLHPPNSPAWIFQWSTHTDQYLTNSSGQATVILKAYARNNVVASPTSTHFTATINGSESNALSLTVIPP
ncbi:MAG: hypothetical protein HXX11_15140 [Desulfuromonadales bacterium]|nr:hypothetical protein [Desulfuromonadales bacterium]